MAQAGTSAGSPPRSPETVAVLGASIASTPAGAVITATYLTIAPEHAAWPDPVKPDRQ